jgi:hypothetical protein
MAPERRKGLLLAALFLALALVVAYRLILPQTAPADTSSSNGRGRGRTAPVEQTVTAPDVRIESLDQEHPRPGESDRNLFRFRAREAPPRPAPLTPVRPPQATTQRPAPPAASSTPAIALKFVGFLQTHGERIAALSDGRGEPVLGKEGETVLGRYKIWRIGEESIELSYLDGTGRTTIRLSGQ